MKKSVLKFILLMLPAVAALFISGCVKDVKPSIKIDDVDALTLDFGSDGGEKTVSLNSTADWSAEGMPDWVTVTPPSGKKGTVDVVIDVAESETGGKREATINFIIDGSSATLTIKHTTEAALTALPEELTAPYQGGEANFAISANTPWTLRPEGESAQYIESISAESGTGDGQITVLLKENGTVDVRTVALLLATSDPEVTPIERRIAISQAANAPMLEPETVEGTVYAPKEGGEIKFAIKSNIAWKLAMKNSSDMQYIERFSPASGDGDGEVSVIFEENNTLDVITFEMLLSSDDSRVSPKIERPILFSQTNSIPELTTDQTQFAIPSEGGQAVFDITSNTKWKISLDDQNQSGLVRRFSTTTGEGNEQVTIDFNPNPSVSPALIGMKLESTDPAVVPKITVPLNFDLNGTSPRLDVGSSQLNISGLGGSASFNIMSNMEWKVAAKNSADKVYIERISPESGTGNGQVTITLKENPTSGPLNIIITVSSDNPDVSPAIVREVTVTLAAGVPPGKPTNVVCTPAYDTAGFSWDYVDRATGYEIEMDDRITTTELLSCKVTGLQPGQSYQWKVRAVRNQTYSDWVEGSTNTLNANPNASWIGNWAGNINKLELQNDSFYQYGPLNMLSIIENANPTEVRMNVTAHSSLSYRNNVAMSGGLIGLFPAEALRNASVVNTGSRLVETLPTTQRLTVTINKAISAMPEIYDKLSDEEKANVLGVKIDRLHFTTTEIKFHAQMLTTSSSSIILTANGSVTVDTSGGGDNGNIARQVAEKIAADLKDSDLVLTLPVMSK